MKNLLIVFAFLLPLALVGQTELPTTQMKKNSLTGSVFLSGDSGVALDYRRTIANTQQLVFGIQTDGAQSRQMVFGYRSNFKTESKLSTAVGFDVLLGKRNVIGDNLVSKTFELLPKADLASFRVVGGLYYKINDRIDFMTELHLKSVFSTLFSRRASNALHFGLKYDF